MPPERIPPQPADIYKHLLFLLIQGLPAALRHVLSTATAEIQAGTYTHDAACEITAVLGGVNDITELLEAALRKLSPTVPVTTLDIHGAEQELVVALVQHMVKVAVQPLTGNQLADVIQMLMALHSQASSQTTRSASHM